MLIHKNLSKLLLLLKQSILFKHTYLRFLYVFLLVLNAIIFKINSVVTIIVVKSSNIEIN